MMARIRTALFVPGHKADWIAKAVRSEADAIIIDLEDSVPAAEKEAARRNAREALGTFAEHTVLIRPNGLDSEHCAPDLAAVARPGLDGLLLPMLTGRDDMIRFDALIAVGEIANGVPRGTLRVLPSFETAGAISAVDEILGAPRVMGLMAAAAKDADVSRSVGFRWSAQGAETLYLRSKILLAGRAAGLDTLLLGLWQDVRDLEGLRTFAQDNAGLGYTGQVIIHPTHAPVANEEYGFSPSQVEYYRGLIAAFEDATRQGHGAVMYRGEHIDLAHAENARTLLTRAGHATTTEDES
jgi:citrate lyase subunit beta / citryl-CoA lyase